MSDKERLQKMKEKIENKHIFYGEINYSGAGKTNFKIIDNARREVWDNKPIIKICCGYYIEHMEVEGEK